LTAVYIEGASCHSNKETQRESIWRLFHHFSAQIDFKTVVYPAKTLLKVNIKPNMANEEETASIRAPEPVTITVVRCRNLVSELAKMTRSYNFILFISLLLAIGLG